ncbi:hypothetical protein L3X38_017077 [Prunus dulcis]|uniref:Uncharacterized protein n=1 Tax=Prunus dulcis TaxID=3755 RepID=A0AAD4Z9Q2_PRUDU|nr:hypothetical protein L3X38_017077 [Prunus dulcis]
MAKSPMVWRQGHNERHMGIGRLGNLIARIVAIDLSLSLSLTLLSLCAQFEELLESPINASIVERLFLSSEAVSLYYC